MSLLKMLGTSQQLLSSLSEQSGYILDGTMTRCVHKYQSKCISARTSHSDTEAVWTSGWLVAVRAKLGASLSHARLHSSAHFPYSSWDKVKDVRGREIGLRSWISLSPTV